jgi:hypothetical protein
MQEGYLECAESFDEDKILGTEIGQSYERTYRLTEKGKLHISKR